MIALPFLRPMGPWSILARIRSCVLRNMSSAAVTLQKHEWIVILPDHEGVLHKRMQVRP